ncbi:hypothetical protein H9637_14700 [Clostridium sp. N37]|uniref:Uncharacterized protein n=1 Tax=Clostridium faecium TaxID=2762223 RepID=A0ABR8YVJ5_9CLOT|nr:hypothetical protein [Clostridium faecium]
MFFFIDSVKKIVLCHRISPNRNKISCIYTLNDVLSKIKDIPSNLKFITDGNLYTYQLNNFSQNGIYFNIEQVLVYLMLMKPQSYSDHLNELLKDLIRFTKVIIKVLVFWCDDGSICPCNSVYCFL